MDTEDVTRLEFLIAIASDLAQQTQKLEDLICNLAEKYKAKDQKKND